MLSFYNARSLDRETNIIGMRLGPGEHLKGRLLLGGVITPEEFDHFHEVRYSLYLRNPLSG
jgi:hypothetical protein